MRPLRRHELWFSAIVPGEQPLESLQFGRIVVDDCPKACALKCWPLLAEYILIAHKPEARDYAERVTRNLCLAVLANLGINLPERLIAVI